MLGKGIESLPSLQQTAKEADLSTLNGSQFYGFLLQVYFYNFSLITLHGLRTKNVWVCTRFNVKEFDDFRKSSKDQSLKKEYLE